MPFPPFAFGTWPRISVSEGPSPPPKRGYLLDLCHAPCHSPCHVLHDGGTAVLEPKVIVAEPGNADPGPFGDVAVAPAIHLGPGEAGDVPAEPDPEPIARRHAGEVLAGE